MSIPRNKWEDADFIDDYIKEQKEEAILQEAEEKEFAEILEEKIKEHSK